MKLPILFDSLKLRDTENRFDKTSICEKMRAIDAQVKEHPQQENPTILYAYKSMEAFLAAIFYAYANDVSILPCREDLLSAEFCIPFDYRMQESSTFTPKVQPSPPKPTKSKDGFIFSLIIGEQIRTLSLTKRQTEQYAKNVEKVYADASCIYIYDGLGAYETALHLLAALMLQKEITFFHSQHNLEESLLDTAPENPLIILDGNEIGYWLKSGMVEVLEACTVIVCSLPACSQLDKLIDVHLASGKIHFLSYPNEPGKAPELVSHKESCNDFRNRYYALSGHYLEISFLENQISKYTAIEKDVTVMQMDSSGLLKLVCFCLIADGLLEEDKVKAYLRASFPSAMVPDRFLKLTEFPVDHQYGIDRGQLPLVFDPTYTDEMACDVHIQEKVIAFIESYTQNTFHEEDLDKPMELLGINSLLFVDFIVSLEDELEFQMPDTMLDVELFKNVKHLIAYISKLKTGGSHADSAM